MDFRIPYIDKQGTPRDYEPDFIVRAKRSSGEPINLIVEVTGMRRDKDEKVQTVKNRWLPAVNAIRDGARWDFLEIAEDIRDARNQILHKLQ